MTVKVEGFITVDDQLMSVVESDDYCQPYDSRYVLQSVTSVLKLYRNVGDNVLVVKHAVTAVIVSYLKVRHLIQASDKNEYTGRSF